MGYLMRHGAHAPSLHQREECELWARQECSTSRHLVTSVKLMPFFCADIRFKKEQLGHFDFL